VVTSRHDRQARLLGDAPPQLWAVVHESAIRTLVGGPEVMRDQLHRLLELAQLPAVSDYLSRPNEETLGGMP
jgi:hypothetical protein